LHSLALTRGGNVWAWGYNPYGGLGNGTYTYSTTPVDVSNLSDVVAISAGVDHSIALTRDGKVWTWGYNANGQLGIGTNTESTTPMQVTNLTGVVVAVASGGYHSLALKSDGKVWAWGYNPFGALGDGTYNSSNIPVAVSSLSGVVAIVGGSVHS